MFQKTITLCEVTVLLIGGWLNFNNPRNSFYYKKPKPLLLLLLIPSDNPYKQHDLAVSITLSHFIGLVATI